MDQEAARRGTSVYLVERRIDMLPKVCPEHRAQQQQGVTQVATRPGRGWLGRPGKPLRPIHSSAAR